MKDKLQEVISQLQGIYSEGEKDFIRKELKGDIDLLTNLRNFFLQGTYEHIKQFSRPDWLLILRRLYFPEIDFDRPLGQVRDLWSYMNPYGRQVDDADMEIEARQILIDYLTQRFKCLINGEEDDRDIKLTSLVPSKDKEPRQNLVDLLARHLIMSGVEGSTSQLLVIANSTKETEKEIKERQEKDSGI